MKNKFIIPIIFFFIIISLFYLLIIDRDPSEVPSALIEKKVPIFEASSLFNDEIFISNKFNVISKDKNVVGKVNYNNFGSSLGNISYTDLLLSL